MRPSMRFVTKKKERGEREQRCADDKRHLCVCRLLFFVIFCSCFLLFSLVHLHNKTRRMSREKPTSQKEETKKEGLFFLNIFWRRNVVTNPTKKRQRRNLCRLRSSQSIFNLFSIFYDTHRHIQENISNFDDIYLTQKGKEKNKRTCAIDWTFSPPLISTSWYSRDWWLNLN